MRARCSSTPRSCPPDAQTEPGLRCGGVVLAERARATNESEVRICFDRSIPVSAALLASASAFVRTICEARTVDDGDFDESGGPPWRPPPDSGTRGGHHPSRPGLSIVARASRRNPSPCSETMPSRPAFGSSLTTARPRTPPARDHVRGRRADRFRWRRLARRLLRSGRTARLGGVRRDSRSTRAIGFFATAATGPLRTSPRRPAWNACSRPGLRPGRGRGRLRQRRASRSLPDPACTYLLLRNRGGGTFEDVTRRAGLAGVRDNPTSAAFADLDNDGDLDLYVCHYMLWDPDHPRLCQNDKGEYFYCDPSKVEPAPDHVFRNDWAAGSSM